LPANRGQLGPNWTQPWPADKSHIGSGAGQRRDPEDQMRVRDAQSPGGRRRSTLCLLPQAYRRFNHPRALAQRDVHPRPAPAGCAIGRHRYLEILNTSQVLDDSLAITAPHVDPVQEMNSGGHDWRRSIHCEWSGPRPDKGYDKPGRGPELSGFVGGTTESPLSHTSTVCAKQLRYRPTLRPPLELI
jgi:hypothetical protein